MKKIIVLAFVLLAATTFTRAQVPYSGDTLRGVGDVVTTSNSVTVYMGFAHAYTAQPTPSTNAPCWRIIRTTYDTNGYWMGVANAYNTNAIDNASLWNNSWTNRVNATYK